MYSNDQMMEDSIYKWVLLQKILAVIIIISIFILSLFRVFYFSSPISLEIIAFISIFMSSLILLAIYSSYKIKSFYPNYYRSHYRSRTFRIYVFSFIIFWTMTFAMALFLSMRLYNIALVIGFVNVIVLGFVFCIFLYYMFIKKQ